jgi:hypothetical protein
MKTAVFISGQLRTFSRCYPTQRWSVYRHFSDLEFFVTVQDQPDAHQILAPLIADYGADRVHIDLRTDPVLPITPAMERGWHEAPYANAAPIHQLLLQHWYQREVWRFFKATVADPEAYSTIIRQRGDNWFFSFTPPVPDCGSSFNTVWTPWWGRFSGLNDRFAIMGEEAAGAYFTLYEAIPHLLADGCPFHPESLLRAQLETSHVHIREHLCAEFGTLRPSGEMRFPEITSIDLAHTTLRPAA